MRTIPILLALLLLIPELIYGQITDDRPHKIIGDADIVDSVHFSSDTVYVLDKLVFVEDGEILTIDPGTVIKSDTGSNDSISALIVARGGQLYAPGTKAEPIIFTSILDDLDDPDDLPMDTTGRGKWGGVVILGQAIINTTSGTNQLAFLPSWETRDEYGGVIDDDSSGVLQFISIRHAGSQCQGIEMPGLTLAGVGSRTVIDHIEVIHGKGDGFDFLGGAPRCKFMVAAFCCDEGFDSNEGFRGFGQYWFTIMPDAYDGGHHAAQHKGGTNPEDGTPYAIPTIANATYIGCGSSAPNPNVCLRFNDNGGGNYYNSIFTDHSQYGIAIEDTDASYPSTECTPSYTEDSEKRLVCGDIDIQGNLWWDFGYGNSVTDIAPQQFSQDIVFSGFNNNDITDPQITRIDRTPGARLLNPNPVMGGISDGTADTLLLPDPWFDRVNFMGAFYPYMALWTDDWSGLDFYGYTEKITFSIVLSPFDSLAYLPLPVEELRVIGTRFINPSVLDTVNLTKIIFSLYKIPGTTYNPDNDIQVRVYSANENFLPDSILSDTYVSGGELAGQWNVVDSLYEVTIELDEPDQPQIAPLSSYFTTFKSVSGDTIKLVTSVLEPCGSKEPPSPCDPENPFDHVISYDGGSSFDFENDLIYDPAIGVGLGNSPTYLDEHQVSVDIQYFGYLIRGLPFTNNITIGLDVATFIQMVRGADNPVYIISLEEHHLTASGDPDKDRDDFISPELIDCRYFEVSDVDMYDYDKNSTNIYYVLINGGGIAFRETYYYYRPNVLDNSLVPWAVVENISLSDIDPGPDGIYDIEISAPPASAVYDRNFVFSDYSMRFMFDLDIDITETIHVDQDVLPSILGTSENRMSVILFNQVLGDFPLVWDYDIFDNPLGEFEFVFDDNAEYTLFHNIVYSGPIFSIGLPKLGSIEINADLGTQATLRAEGGLSTVNSLNTLIEPQISTYASATINFESFLSIAAGRFSFNDQSNYNFHMEINDTPPIFTSGHCFNMEMGYSYYIRVLWKRWRGSGTKTILIDCPKEDGVTSEDLVVADVQTQKQEDDTYYDTPAMATSYDESMLMAAFPHKEADDKIEIYYSLHDGNHWSEPEPATNTSYSKGDLDLTAKGIDGFAAVWVEQNEFDTVGFNFETDFLELFKSQDIVVSQYNALTQTWQNPVRITNDQKTDGRPTIAGNQDGIIYVAWVHNEDTEDYLPTNNRIDYAVYNGATWSSPTEIPGQSGYNLQPDLSVDTASGNAILVWVQDLDGVIKSFGDRDLKLVEIDPSGAIVHQETVGALDGPFSPSVAVSDDGDIVIGYERWGDMIVKDAYGSHTDTVGLGDNIKIAASIDRGSGWQTYAIGDVDTAGYGANPKVIINNHTDSAYIIAQGFEKGDTMRYDGEIIATSISLIDDPGQWIKPEFLIYDTIYNLMGDAEFDPAGELRILYLADIPTTTNFPAGLDQIYEISSQESCCDAPGDANNDGACNIGDEVYLGNYIFRPGQCDNPPGNTIGCPPECVPEGDANADGAVNIGDEVFLGNYIFRPPPVSPAPECGPGK